MVQKEVYNYTYTYNIWGLDNVGQVQRNGSSQSRYYYLKDHLGSVRMIVDAGGTAQAWNDYYPFGTTMTDRSRINGNLDWRYQFTGKERDVFETGYDYFGAWYYDSWCARWLSVDPMAEKYPGWSPYCYALCNPMSFIDPDGSFVSTHTDSQGSVLAVYDDGDLGVYRHNNAETKEDVDTDRQKTGTEAGGGEKMGETWTWDALSIGMKIQFGSNDATTAVNSALYSIASMSPNEGTLSNLDALLEYASNAGNGEEYDLKFNRPAGTATLLFGKYATFREAGNFLAGYVASRYGLQKETTLRAFGAFNLNYNSRVLGLLGKFIFNPGPPYYGETPQSSQYQALGWDYENAGR